MWNDTNIYIFQFNTFSIPKLLGSQYNVVNVFQIELRTNMEWIIKGITNPQFLKIQMAEKTKATIEIKKTFLII